MALHQAALVSCVMFTLLAPAVCQAEVHGTKAEGIRGQDICIVDNSYTAPDFRDAYERRIRAKGDTTRRVQEKSACPVTTTFVATYGRTAWGPFLHIAMLAVWRDGEEIGVVRYRGSRHKPFKGRVEDVIGEMVDVLYP